MAGQESAPWNGADSCSEGLGAERSRQATIGGRESAPWNGADSWSRQVGPKRSR